MLGLAAGHGRRHRLIKEAAQGAGLVAFPERPGSNEVLPGEAGAWRVRLPHRASPILILTF